MGSSVVRELVTNTGTGCADVLRHEPKMRSSIKSTWRTRYTHHHPMYHACLDDD